MLEYETSAAALRARHLAAVLAEGGGGQEARPRHQRRHLWVGGGSGGGGVDDPMDQGDLSGGEEPDDAFSEEPGGPDVAVAVEDVALTPAQADQLAKAAIQSETRTTAPAG
jgi:hypothetical protein